MPFCYKPSEQPYFWYSYFRYSYFWSQRAVKVTCGSPGHQPGARAGGRAGPPTHTHTQTVRGVRRSSLFPQAPSLAAPPGAPGRAPAATPAAVRPPPEPGDAAEPLTFPLLLTTEAQQHFSPPRRPRSGEARPSAGGCLSALFPVPGAARRLLCRPRPLRGGGGGRPGPLRGRGGAAGIPPLALLRLRFPLGARAGGCRRRGGGGDGGNDRLRLRPLVAAAAGGGAPPAAEVARGTPEHSARPRSRAGAAQTASPARMRAAAETPPPPGENPAP